MSDGEKETAKALAERVGASLDEIVVHHAHELGIDPKWVISEIVWQATQRAREIREMSYPAGKTQP